MKRNPKTKYIISDFVYHHPYCSLAHDSDVSDNEFNFFEGLVLDDPTMQRVVFERRIYPTSAAIGHFGEQANDSDSQEQDMINGVQSAVTPLTAPKSKKHHTKHHKYHLDKHHHHEDHHPTIKTDGTITSFLNTTPPTTPATTT